MGWISYNARSFLISSLDALERNSSLVLRLHADQWESFNFRGSKTIEVSRIQSSKVWLVRYETSSVELAIDEDLVNYLMKRDTDEPTN
jgi:trimethylamine:corrinoid methyltransferase-like protein